MIGGGMTLPQLPPRELAQDMRADMAVILPCIYDASYSFEQRCKFRREYLALARLSNALVRQASLDERRAVHYA